MEDTIAAISTPPGTGGIGIIRISGEKSFKIASRIFKGAVEFENIKTHTINYGKIIDPSSHETLDEVLVSKMKRPASFTKEDVVEINCHGGIIVLRKILGLIVKEGARIAEPGEFTKRAFLNGRIDLSQAEAVIDLINSKTDAGSKAALNQLEGKLSKKLKEVREKLIELIAHIEVTVDYPEHDIEEITGDMVYESLKPIKSLIYNISETFENGRMIREGLNVVIVGRPNVGKSSLLNELSGKNKAIVTDIPGTTRDIIEEYINIKGIPIKLIDTAGIRETEDVVERIGVERAKKAVNESDLTIMMIDGEAGIISEDIEIFNEVRNKRNIVILNKIDISSNDKIKEIENYFKDYNLIKISIKTGSGIEKIEEELTGLFNKGSLRLNDEILLTNIRHKNMIDKCMVSIDNALSAYDGGMPLDMITIDIKDAAYYLGQITGESVNEQVLNEIFKRFCIGK
ncbi:tRNA uridine-5-carboxymethylaminomethyl(34) synthesis GTPase MnmE [Pseudobacteroides cellulosolvens]|uniref:tRNA modification GTPase MnmE n=1 Tax=Pseudobacteroides cellulosolvens ATCC 35603 = DSM 2933 TaxID=398512 RepID=A0A0L6JVK1_9FIRM|nr:tRNA uridine-5-carboxymethylaminomethyl(34) synthesis GTPase MnmE [Pseudobacteroides cellulosolvens]KNY29734.1 tRNA modification GTPase mnmE [Pseudobacteroides cellulosolvens ATCC 35603 = DSM 2933]